MKILLAVLLLGVVSAAPHKRGEGSDEPQGPETHTIDVDMKPEMFPEPSMAFIISQVMKNAKIKAYFTSMDVDMSGALSKNEFVDATMSLDMNGDGYLTEEEFASVIDNAASQIAEALQLDTDGDGFISTKELIAFLGVHMPKPDEDKTPEEFGNEVGNATLREIQRRAAMGMQGKKGQKNDKRPAEKIKENLEEKKEKLEEKKEKLEGKKEILEEKKEKLGEKKENIKEEMTDEMGIKVPLQAILDELKMLNISEGILYFISMDINQDGEVTQDEVEQIFQEMDENGDGMLQEDEYARHMGLLNGLVASFRDVDRNGDGFISGKEVLFAAVHKHAIMRMMFEESMKNAAGEEQNNGYKKKRSAANLGLLNMQLMAAYNITVDDLLFEVYDVDGNGEITKEEYVIVFMAKDTDHNGVLTPEELSGAYNNIITLVHGFLMADNNFDGVISIREFIHGALQHARMYNNYQQTEEPEFNYGNTTNTEDITDTGDIIDTADETGTGDITGTGDNTGTGDITGTGDNTGDNTGTGDIVGTGDSETDFEQALKRFFAKRNHQRRKNN